MDKSSTTALGPEAAPARGMRWSARRITVIALVAVLALLPVATAVWNEPFYLTLVSRIMIYGLAALGLNLILGYGAMVSFGHALYVGVGAYAVAILGSHGITNGMAHLGVALGAGLVISVLVGMVCLRTSGLGFIMITLAFAQMFYFLMIGLRAYGGDDGLPVESRSTLGPIDLSNNVTLYYLIFAVLMATLYGFHRLVRSRFGIVLRGTKANERRMRALGFATLRYKLLAYVISAQVCVVAGLLLANLTRYASPSYMQWTTSGELVVMAVLGGLGTLIGPVLGASIWLVLEELLSSFHLGLPWGLDAFIRSHWMFVLGAVIVVVSLTLKQGLYGYLVQREENTR